MGGTVSRVLSVFGMLSEEEDDEDPQVAPAQQPGEMEELQVLQEEYERDLSEEELERGRALFHCRVQESLLPTEDDDLKFFVDTPDSASDVAEDCAAMLEELVRKNPSTGGQVPMLVREIYRWLLLNTDVSAEHRLDKSLLELARAHPHDVVVTLLHCAPSCDRVAASMWRTMMSEHGTAGKVMQEVLSVLEKWPLHSTSTSDGDTMDVFVVAATKVLREILPVPQDAEGLRHHFPYLLLALLFQVFWSTVEEQEEINPFLRECLEQVCLPTSPSRFAVQTVKALLCSLDYEAVVFEVERKRGWDMLLDAESHHSAMGLLAREMRGMESFFRSRMVRYLVKALNRKEPCWGIPAMAFLVELLACPDMGAWDECVLELLPLHMQSVHVEMRRLVLRGLLTHCQRPGMAKQMMFLVPSFIQLLQDMDGEVVSMTLCVLRNVLENTVIPIAGPIVLQLAENLRLLFDSESSTVQLLSLHLFQVVMELSVEVGKKEMKALLRPSLLPLLFHVYDEDQRVAAASRVTLLGATKLLRMKKLRRNLRKEQSWRLGKCLLADDSSRVEEYLHQCLLYLLRPQESMREGAVRFLGYIGRHVMGQQEELQLIYKALEAVRHDTSLTISKMAAETLAVLRREEENPSFGYKLQAFRGQLQRLWRRK